MNAAIPAEALHRAAREAGRVLLTGPLYPDGDSIGACLALARGVRAIGRAEVDVAGDLPSRYAWMPGAGGVLPDAAVPARAAERPYDLAIVLDGERRRLPGPVQGAFAAAKRQGIIDHHSSTNTAGYDIALVDPAAASTCEMVHDLLEGWGVPVDRDTAALLYTGLIFDTGGFRHSNTTPRTHRLAAQLLETGIDHAPIAARILAERRPAGLRLLGHVLERAAFFAGGALVVGVVEAAVCAELGCETGDLEGIVDAMVFTEGVELACLCVEKGPSLVKLSLRSRSRVNVAALAHALIPDGGGHPRAAGALLPCPLADVRETLPARLVAALG